MLKGIKIHARGYLCITKMYCGRIVGKWEV